MQESEQYYFCFDFRIHLIPLRVAKHIVRAESSVRQSVRRVSPRDDPRSHEGKDRPGETDVIRQRHVRENTSRTKPAVVCGGTVSDCPPKTANEERVLCG